MGEPSERTVTIAAGEDIEVFLGFGHAGFCQTTQNVLSPTGSSFIAPTADHRRAYGLVIVRLSAPDPEALLVVGHTDETGSPTTNDPLSDRRARAALAVLTDRPEEWEDIFRTERRDGSSPRWSEAEFEAMLRATGTALSPAAVRQHRELTSAGQVRREALFRAYFRVLRGTAAPPVTSLTPPQLGCGERHTLGPGDHPDSRRAEFFFFRGVPPTTVDCDAYPSWRNPCVPIPLVPILVVENFFVSVIGDDLTGDGSLASPWQTLPHSLSEVERLRTPGKRAQLSVMPGSYAGNVALPSEFILTGFGRPLPEIVGSSSGDPVLELGPGTRNTAIEDLRITDGHRSGVRINGATGIAVLRCEIADNKASRGGGIAVVEAVDVTIEDNVIEFNQAGDISSAVASLVIESGLTELTRFEFEPGESHGGGIYLENSSDVAILDNRIRDNWAILFGGGIAVDNEAGFPGAITIRNNEIGCNQVTHGDLSELEAPEIRCDLDDMGDPLVERFMEEISEVVSRRVVSLLHGVGRENGLGGGLALRHVSSGSVIQGNRIGVRERDGDTEAAPNRARRGGGIECFTGAYPRIEGNTVAFNLTSDDGGGVAIDQFDPFLPASQPRFLGFRRGRLFTRQTIRVVGNRLRFNRSVEDGGGLYATGGALVEMEGGLVEGNRAGENGGGVRVSYAVHLTVHNATLRANESNTIRPFIGVDKEGGGGIAARNAAVTLEGCTLESNSAHEFAGGGGFFNSAFEGGFDERGFIENRSGQFDEIMDLDHAFRERHYEFINCQGNGNRATDSSGAGGFFYAVRVEGNERLEVVIRGAGTAIGTNTSEHDSGKRGNIVVELSGRTDLTGRPEDLVSIHGDVPSVPSGVAVSTPSPGAAVRIIHRGGRPDDLPLTFPFQNVPPVFGTVFPSFGPVAGGTTVNLFGDGFLPGVEVLFDGVDATVVSVTSLQIVVETPPGGIGPRPHRDRQPRRSSRDLSGCLSLYPATARLRRESRDRAHHWGHPHHH